MIQKRDLEELKRYQPGGDLYEPARVVLPTIQEAIDVLCDLRVQYSGTHYSAALGVAINTLNAITVVKNGKV